MAIAIGLRLLDVGDVSDLFGGGDESEWHVGRRPDERIPCKRLHVGRWGVMGRNNAKSIRLAQEQGSKLGAADTYRVLEHGLKDRP